MFRHALWIGVLLVGACRSTSEDESMCLKRKPGTIVTANEYCAIVLDDPVDPSIVVDWNGQKVGFCCKGCLPRWEKLTAAEKDAALAAAIAKGRIRD
ncbi:MAG: hypothetical protein L6Q99_20840 [Planctomycetes bacterium]|nr:hypothetical protein [Planctomycetota bacterium]